MPPSPPSRQSSITAPAIAIPGAIAIVLALIIGVLIAGLAAGVRQEALPSDIQWTVAVTSALTLLFFVVIVIVAINAHQLSEIHRRAEAELRLREYELEQFFDLSPGPKAVTRLTGQFVRANRAFCELTGYTEDELRHRTLFDLAHPADRDAHVEWLEQLLKGEIEQYTIEKRYIRRDERIIHVALQSNLLYDAAGRPAFVIGQAIDITARLQAEETARKSDERFRALVEYGSDAVSILDAAGNITFATQAAYTILGYDPGEFVGRNVFDLIHPADAPRCRSLFQKLLSDPGEIVRAELRMRHRDGRWLWVEAAGSNHLSSPAIAGVVANFRDITERKRAEEALRHQNELLTALHETAIALLNRRELLPLLNSVVLRAAALMDTPHGFLDLVWPDGLTTEQKIGHGMFQPYVGNRVKAGEGVTGAVLTTGQPCAVDDYQTWPSRPPAYTDLPARALVSIPLKSGDRVVGLFGLAYTEPGRTFSPAQIDTLSRFAELAALVLDNIRLYEAAQAELQERQRAEIAAERERDFAMQVMNTLGQGVTVSDADGTLVYVNPTLAHLVGRRPEDLVGQKAQTITLPEYHHALRQALAERRVGQSSSHEIKLRHANGHAIPVLVTGTPRWQGDVHAGSIAVITDLTEQKRIETVRESIYQIARATAETDSLDELFAAVHGIINTVMPANNFYIALYDAKDDLLSFPYFVDEIDQPTPPQKPGRGLTEYVLRTGRSLLCDAELDLKMQQLGETDLVGVSMAVWLGVPLIVDKKTIGVMAVQHYADPRVFTDNERQVLEFVSAEVARAIERRRAADALRESEARFSHIFHNAPAAISLSDDDTGEFIDCNEGYCRFTGYSREEIIGRTRTQIGLWPSAEERQRVLAQLDVNPSLKNEIIRYRTKAGDVRSALISSEVIVINGQKCRLSMLVDITERAAAEEALRRSEERFRALAENIPGVIYQCRNDERHTMLFLNDAIADITGCPKEDFLSGRLSLVDLYHPDDVARAGLYSSVKSAVAARQPFHLIYRLRHKSGEWRWVEEWGTGIYNSGGELQYLEGFLSDITERKRTDEALARTVRELAALDHMGKAVAASLELATVLSAVIDEVSPLIKAEGISILLPDTDNRLVFAAASGPASGGLVGHRIPRMAGAAGGVMQTGRSILVTSGEGDSQLYREVEKVSHFHTRSLLAVPLRLSGEIIGVMEAVHTEPDAFSTDDQRLLEAAATWAATAIGNARQHERLQRRLQESEAFARISGALNETLNLQHILELIVDSAIRVIPRATRAVIHLFDETENLLKPVAASGGRPLGDKEVVMRPGEGISGRVFLEGSLINVGNTAAIPGFIPGPPEEPLESLLSVPVESATHRLGTLNVDSGERNAFTEDDERLLTHLGVQAALAIENARLFEASRRRADELNIASQILRSLNAATNVVETFPDIAANIKLITGCDRVSLGLYNEAYTVFTVIALDQPRPEIPVGTALPVNHESAIAQNLLAGRIHLTAELGQEPDLPGVGELLQAGYQSRASIPLRDSDGRVIGAINLSWPVPNGFRHVQFNLLDQIAEALALAMQKSRLLAETTDALHREQRLNEVVRAISNALDIPSTLSAVTRLAAEVVAADAASLALIDPKHDTITSIQLHNFDDFGAAAPLSRGQGVVWQIIDSGQPLVLDDYSAHANALPEWKSANARAFVGVPVVAGQECLGVLGLFRFNPEPFNSRDVAVAESVGRQAGIAIQNARLFEALSQEKRRIELLYTLTQNLTTSLNPREVADRAVQLTTETLGLEIASINLLEPGTERIHVFAMTGYTEEQLRDVDRLANMHVGAGLGGRAALTKKPALAPDTANDPYWVNVPGPDDQARSAASIPLMVGDELIGVMTMVSSTRAAFTDDQLPLLTAIAAPVALALKNAQLFDAERQQVQALTALHEIGLELSTELDLSTLLRSIIERAARLLDAPMGALSLLLPDGETLELTVSYNMPASYTGLRLKVGQGATGLVAQTGAALVVDDYETWPLRAEVYREAVFRSIVLVPIKWRGRVMGVISVNHHRPGSFVRTDAELVALFADQAAVAIANANQHKALQRRLQESEAVASVSRALNETLDLQRLLQLIVETANNVIPNVDRAVIHLLDKDGETLRPAAVSGAGTSLQTVIMRAGEGVAGQVIAHGQVINVGDTHSDPRYLNPEHASPIRSLLVAPIHSGTHRVGTISVNSATPYAFSADDERLLGTLGTQTALALYNAQLFQDTRRQLDELVLLHSITLAAAEATTEDDLIQRATHLIGSTFQPVSFGVMLIDETGGALVAHSSYLTGPRNFRIPLGKGITGRVAATGQPWLVDDVTREPAYVGVEDDTRSELCVPLKSGNLILGVLNAESERPNAFTETDLRLLATLAGQLTTAIQRLRLVRDLEQALKQEKSTRAQLVQSEKLAAMGRLVASVAHELNNPLQAIQNALYLVRQEPAISQQAIDDLQVAATEANRMADLINRLRETYRPATNEEFRYESLNTIVTDVQKLIATHLRHKDIEFKFEPDPDLPYIPGIRDQLKQVLLNLSLNGVEAMPSGGCLTIRTRYEPASHQVLLAVSDTGAGIAPDVIGSVFDPFFTTKESGTGLGLTITFDIIQRHRGRIEIDSEPGRGATFLIWLPTETQSKHS